MQSIKHVRGGVPPASISGPYCCHPSALNARAHLPHPAPGQRTSRELAHGPVDARDSKCQGDPEVLLDSTPQARSVHSARQQQPPQPAVVALRGSRAVAVWLGAARPPTAATAKALRPLNAHEHTRMRSTHAPVTQQNMARARQPQPCTAGLATRTPRPNSLLPGALVFALSPPPLVSNIGNLGNQGAPQADTS